MTEATPCDETVSARDSCLDVEDILAELRDRGFDLRRRATVTYLVQTGTDRDAAYAIGRRAAGDGWTSSLYAQGYGWTVRLVRDCSLRPDILRRGEGYVHGLAEAHGALVGGVVIEDLSAVNRWDALAATS